MLPYITYYWLVVDLPTPPKNMKVNWDYDIPNIWKKCSKPPTRLLITNYTHCNSNGIYKQIYTVHVIHDCHFTNKPNICSSTNMAAMSPRIWRPNKACGI